MKILLLNQVFYPDSAATAQHSTDLARALVRHGCEVSVITENRSYNKREIKFEAYEELEGIKIHRVGSFGFPKTHFVTRLVDSISFEFAVLLKLMSMPPQDVVISFTSPPLIGLLGALFCAVKGGRAVQWLMDINPAIAIAVGYLRKSSLTSRFLLKLFQWTLKASDRVVVLDRLMKQHVVDHGVSCDKVLIVPPWPVHSQKTETPPFADAGVREFRRELGLDDKFVILYSGNHSIVHPLDTLLQAALLLRDDAAVRFLFIGGGLRTEDVEAFAKTHALSNIIQLQYQPREKLHVSLPSADLHVAVMGDEVNGLLHVSKIYGILATGRPFLAIAPKESHLRDMTLALGNSFHVEHGDVKGLVAAIRSAMAQTEAERTQIFRHNSRYVVDRFAMERCLKPLLDDFFGVKTPVQELPRPRTASL